MCRVYFVRLCVLCEGVCVFCEGVWCGVLCKVLVWMLRVYKDVCVWCVYYVGVWVYL